MKGTGYLVYSKGTEFHGLFSLAINLNDIEYPHKIMLDFEVDCEMPLDMFSVESANLVGDDGRRVSMERLKSCLHESRRGKRHIFQYGLWHVFYEYPQTSNQVNFFIPNMYYIGPSIFCGASRSSECVRTEFEGKQYEIFIESFPISGKSGRKTIYSDKARITHRLSISSVDGQKCEYSTLRTLADRVCNLLSVAEGRTIDWAFSTVKNERSLFLKEFKGLSWSSPKSGRPLLNIHDSTRISKILSCLETLNALELHTRNKMMLFVSDIHLSSLTPNSSARIAILSSGWEVAVSNLFPNTYDKIPLEDKMNAYLDHFEIEYDREEIELFIKARNDIMHGRKESRKTSELITIWSKNASIAERLVMRIIDFKDEFTFWGPPRSKYKLPTS